MIEPEPKPDRRATARSLMTRENLLAVLVCLIIVALVVFSSGTSPQWIYQGF